MTIDNPYQARGTFTEKSYIERDADIKLKALIKDNKSFPYFLAPRQSGKSSVMERARSLFATEGLRIIIIDLSLFSQNKLIDFDEFMLNFVISIYYELDVTEKLGGRLRDLENRPKFFFDAVKLLLESIEGRIVVCIDELDALIACNFKDDFLSHIRALFNMRASDPVFNRIQFILAAAVSQNYLISDLNRSPFNVGTQIILRNFDKEQIDMLISVENWLSKEDVDHASNRILYWTNGSVFLSQSILEKAYWLKYEKEASDICELIDHIVEEMIVSAPHEIHFINITKQLGKQPHLLSAWKNWIDGKVPDREVKECLSLVGISDENNPIRNRIYREVFSAGGPLCLVPGPLSGLKPADELADVVDKAASNWEIKSRNEISSGAHQNLWIYVNGLRPAIDQERIFGREKELKDIENLLQDKSTLVITGLRGTGKSTLASMFVERMGRSGKFAGIYWRKVDETVDISDIIGSFFTVIGKPVKDLEHYKIPDQINLMLKELKEAPYLLVLDNFEILLNPQTSKILESKIGFSELIEKANENDIRSKMLFISWDSFSSDRGIRPLSYQIKGLDKSAGIFLLKREGLSEPENELKKAVELSGGHPLALILLAQLMKEGDDTLSALLNDDSLWIGKDGEVAVNILNKVYNERLSEDERMLLQYVSIFRLPVPAKAIVSIANNSDWYVSKVKKVAINLTRKSLLKKDGENYREELLIRKYAATRLSEKSECHRLACKYFISLPLSAKREKKEDVQSLIEAHYHACMAEEYDLAFNIIFDNNLHEYLDLWGNYTVLIDLYSRLLPENHFGNEILLEYKGSHGIILGDLGLIYYYLGELRKAIEYYEQALKIEKEIGDKHGEGARLGNLGLAYSALGETKQAIDYHEQALIIAREIGDRREEGADLGNLGLAYSSLGDAKKAIDYYEQALKIAREIGDRRGEEVWLGNLGLAYSDLGETRKAIEYHKQALKIAIEIGDIRGEGNQLGNMGLAYSALGDAKKAIDYYEQALKIALEIGDRRGEGIWLGNLGNAYYYLGELKEAIEYHEQALKIAREIGDRHGEGNRLGNMGNAYSDLGNAKKAIDYYKQAMKIAREIGDIRNEGALLGSLGLAHSDLGDAKKAIDYYEQALAIAREIGDRRGEDNRLGNLGLAYSDLGDAKKAIDYYEQALAIAREIGDRRGEGTVLGNLGLAYSDRGEKKKAIEYSEHALKIAEEIGDRRGVEIWLGNLGFYYRDQGEAKKAIEYSEHALKIAREISDRRNEGLWIGNLGNVYRDLGEAKKAIDYYEQALKIAREVNDIRIKGLRLGNLGGAYLDLGDVKKAIDYYEQALKIAREIDDRRGEGIWLGNLGSAYRNKGEAKKAIDYYEQALKIAGEIDDGRKKGLWIGNLGSAYRDLGETKKAIEYYDQALKVARETDDRWGEEIWLGNLGLAYNDLGETKKAIDYYEQALKIAWEISDRRNEGLWIGNLGLAYSSLGELKKAIEFLKGSLAIGKAIGDSRIINLCEQKLKDIEGFSE